MRPLLCAVAIAAAAGACSAGGNSGSLAESSSGGSGNSGGTGNIALGGTSSVDVDPNANPLAGSITSAVGDQTTVAGAPVPVQFTVTMNDGTTPTNVVWTVDDTRIGAIDQSGVFTANGFVGGVVTITASVGDATATFQFIVNVDILENPGNVSEADQGALLAGGSGDANFRWLYPYDGTVFPRGLAAPLLQLAGTAPTATYLAVTAPYFSYRQFAGASTYTRVTIPEQVWRGLTLTAAGTDTVTLAVSKSTGGAVSGPASSTLKVAPADIKGIIYYSTYKSPKTNGASNDPTKMGGIMALRPGSDAEVVIPGCTVCHSVSANGSVLSAGIQHADSVPPTDAEWNNSLDSGTYDLSPEGGVAERVVVDQGRTFQLAGLSPDGSLAVTNGLPPDRFEPYVPHGTYGQKTGWPSDLVSTTTGLAVTSNLAEWVEYAQSPAFAPDGTRVAFVNGDRLPERVLTVLDFDGAAQFSNMRDVADGGTKAVAWPTFLPDAKALIYHEGDSYDSSGFVLDATQQSKPQYGELRLAEIESQTVNSLEAVNGRSAGESYLPYGELEEGRMNYEPSVVPVAVGGYYWVLFTSRRAYGNTVAPGGELEETLDPWGTNSAPSFRKKVWVAAIDIDYAGKPDPSHPAFYLPGQELEAGNMRAYAALAPCKADGQSCESGADCCGGFCRQTGSDAAGQPVLQCVPPPEDTCSNLDELCTSPADCCSPDNLCINNRCALPPPK